MKIKSLNIEMTFEELAAIAALLGNLNDSDYLKYASTQENVLILKDVYSSITPILVIEG